MLASPKELAEMGFSKRQIEYLLKAKAFHKVRAYKSVKDIQDDLGYGIVDEAVLQDTFFS